MLRTLVVTLLFFAAAAPALAGPQERANELFVEAVKLIQAGNQAPEVERRLEYVEQAQVKLHRIIADYPSSDLAVQLISGQRVGAISLQSVRSAVEAAELEVNEQRASRAAAANEQRASRAAAAIEALLMRLAASKTAEEGEPIAASIESELVKLSSEYGATDYYRNLHKRFERTASWSLEGWAKSASAQIRELLSLLAASKTAEEGEPIAVSIEDGLTELSKKHGPTSHYQNLRQEFWRHKSKALEKWAGSVAKPVEELLSKLVASKSVAEDQRLMMAVASQLEAMSPKFERTAVLAKLRQNLKNSARHMIVLKGHSGSVQSASFNPDGTRVVTGSKDKTARIWDVVTGQELTIFDAHYRAIWSASFSPDGKRVVTGSLDKTARIWETSTGKQIVVLDGHSGSVRSASFSPDGTMVVTGSNDRTVRLWDATTGEQVAVFKANDSTEWSHEEAIWSVAFSPDGKHIVSGSFDETARIWEVSTGKQLGILTGHSGGVESASFSPDGTWVVTGSADTTARIWVLHRVLQWK